jgi:ligand-binding sensor domain-containing protein
LYWKATRAVSESAADVASETQVSFTTVNLDRPPLPGIEPILTPPAFHDIASFEGSLYLTGATGLYVYSMGGALQRSYRAGIQLPAAELGQMAEAVLTGTSAQRLFIATSGEGLLSFDGQHFRQLLPNRAELRNVTCLLALSTGRVLFGTDRAGVFIYDGATITALDSKLSGEHVTALAGSEGDVWAGTLRNGLWHLHGGRIDRFVDALADPQVLSLAAWNDNLYAGTPVGVVEFQQGRKTRTLADGLFARAISADDRGVTVGSEDEGLFEIGRNTRHFTDEQLDGLPVERIAAIAGTRLALTAAAVFEQDGGRWNKVLSAEKGVLTDRHVSALAFGPAGGLWVGYFDRGLDIVAADRTPARHLEDDHLFCVNRIAAGGQRTAVATANGLVLFDAEQQVRQVLGRKDGLMADHITDVAFQKNGLIAATPAGLTYIDREGVRGFYVFNGLVNNHVYALGSFGDQVLAGTLGGLSVLDHQVIRANYTTANSGLKHNWITALARVGDDWFAGTYGAGVMRLDNQGHWHSFPDLQEKYVVNPNALLAVNGRVFAGSLDNGLYIYDVVSGRWTNFRTGLPSRNVTALAAQGRDIYAGTDNGVVRIEERLLP